MKKINDLIELYPNLYKQKDSRYAMQKYGFQILDYYYPLMAHFSFNINQLLEEKEIEESLFFISQIKTKFEELRIYYHLNSENLELRSLIEKEIEKTCYAFNILNYYKKEGNL